MAEPDIQPWMTTSNTPAFGLTHSNGSHPNWAGKLELDRKILSGLVPEIPSKSLDRAVVGGITNTWSVEVGHKSGRELIAS